MDVPLVFVYLKESKEVCSSLAALLHKNKHIAIEVIPTIAMCNKLLKQCIQKCVEKKNGNVVVPEFLSSNDVMFKEIHTTLLNLERKLNRLIRSRKVPIISKIMTPKQSLINENRKLFYTITSLEKNVIDLSKKTFKEIDDPESTLSLDELFNDKESYSIWKNNFCGCTSVPTESVLSLLQADLKPKDKEKICYILDPRNTREVKLSNFKNFVRLFGPLSNLKDNLDYLASLRWFHGYINADSAKNLLKMCPSGTFLIRFSFSRPGCIVISFVTNEETNEEVCFGRSNLPTQQISHITVIPLSFEEFKVKEYNEEDKVIRTFSSLEDVIKHYKNFLQIPLSPRVANEKSFQRMLNEIETKALLQSKSIGTYLFRFADPKIHNCSKTDFVLSYVGDDNNMIHEVIEYSAGGFTIRGDCHTYLSLSELVETTEYVKLSEPTTFSSVQVAKRMSRIFSSNIEKTGIARKTPSLKEIGRSKNKQNLPIALFSEYLNRVENLAKDELRLLDNIFSNSEPFNQFLEKSKEKKFDPIQLLQQRSRKNSFRSSPLLQRHKVIEITNIDKSEEEDDEETKEESSEDIFDESDDEESNVFEHQNDDRLKLALNKLSEEEITTPIEQKSKTKHKKSFDYGLFASSLSYSANEQDSILLGEDESEDSYEMNTNEEGLSGISKRKNSQSTALLVNSLFI